jgi:hypothetical protein
MGKTAAQVGHVIFFPAGIGLALRSTFPHSGQANVTAGMMTSGVRQLRVRQAGCELDQLSPIHRHSQGK